MTTRDERIAEYDRRNKNGVEAFEEYSRVRDKYIPTASMRSPQPLTGEAIEEMAASYALFRKAEQATQQAALALV